MTTKELSNTEKIMLEGFIDSYGLVAVIESLAEICDEKSDHLQTNWQEHPASDQVRTWTHNGGYLQKVAGHVWRQSWER